MAATTPVMLRFSQGAISVWRVATLGVVAFTLFGVPVSGAAAQATRLVDTLVCKGCELRLSHYATLGDSVGAGRLGANVRTIARDKLGRYWLAVYRKGSPVYLFEPAGRFLKHVDLGRREPDDSIHVPVAVHRGPTDSMYVLFGASFRMSVFSPRGDIVRSYPMKVDGVSDLVVSPTGDALVAANTPTPDEAGIPLHFFNNGGRHIRSMGAEWAAYRGEYPILLDRRVTWADRPDRFWVAHVAKYVLEQRDPQGKKLVELRRPAGWFEGTSLGVRPSESQAPSTQITSLRRDAKGRLWIAALTPDRQWRQALRKGSTLPGGKENWNVSSFDRLFDTVIEVIDPSQGRLIASTRVDQCVPFLLDDASVASFGSLRGSVPVVHVWRIQLFNQPREGGK